MTVRQKEFSAFKMSLHKDLAYNKNQGKQRLDQECPEGGRALDLVHATLIALTRYNFPSLVSPTDKHFHTFLFAVNEYFWLVSLSMDSKRLGIALEMIFEKLLLCC